MMQIVNQAAGKLQDHHHQSLATLQQGCFTHPSLKWQYFTEQWMMQSMLSENNKGEQ